MNIDMMHNKYKTFQSFAKANWNMIEQLNREGVLRIIYNSFKEKGRLKYSFEDLEQAALLCNTRYEFKNRFPGIYETTRRFNFLNIICNHMIRSLLAFSEKVCQQISESLFNMHCIANTRNVIAPYELDIFFPSIKVAIEFQGDYWHSSLEMQERDALKEKLCNERGILLIHIYEKGHSHQDNIHLIREQFIDNLVKINTFLNSTYTHENIISNIDVDKIYNSIAPIDERSIISNYSDLKSFAKNEKALYDRIRKSGKMHLLEPLRERRYPYKWRNMTDEDILNIIVENNFSSFTEFSKHETLRTICRRRNLINRVRKLYL